MKIEILMLKENNERGVRMMFLSLEQLQKLKLNPTCADYEIAYETEVKEQEGTAYGSDPRPCASCASPAESS